MLSSESLPAVPDTHLLDGLQGKLLDVEPVYRALGVAELHDGDILH